MPDPTPDEAAAPCQKCQVYPDGTVYRTRCICPEPMTPEQVLRGVAGLGGDIGDAVRDLLAERDDLRAEGERARSREQAVRDLADDLPDLLQTYAWSHQDGTWAGYAEFVAEKLCAALGPVETPQEENRG